MFLVKNALDIEWIRISITYGQRMENAGAEVADFQLVVVLVNSEDKPTRIPDDLKQILKPYEVKESTK